MIQLLSTIIIALVLTSVTQSKPLILPVQKDILTLQYFTSIQFGTRPPGTRPTRLFLDLLIDLGSPFLWIDCDNTGYISSAYKPVNCGSTQCKDAGGTTCLNCNGPRRPGCTNNTCGLKPYNAVTKSFSTGGLGQDVLAFYQTDGLRYEPQRHVPDMALVCAHSSLLHGLADDTRGVFGFGNTRLAIYKQLSIKLNIPPKFTICLPNSKWMEVGSGGTIIIGGGPYIMPPDNVDVSQFMSFTPLSTKPVTTSGDPSVEYFIRVNSIKVDGKSLRFDSSLLNGGTKLSTVTPYTVLHSAIYEALVKDFVERSKVKGMRRVKPVAPFGVCFKPKTVGIGKSGADVPTIDLVLSGRFGEIQWSIFGSNSMVKVNRKAICLGFVDGGLKPSSSIVLGGHQLEDNLLEFDMSRSVLGFTSSLLVHNQTCSHFISV